MTLPTSWLDLDWDDPDPWDMRYYQSLIMAAHERVWQQPAVTPLESNTYPPALRTNGVPYRVDYYSQYVLVQPWMYLSPKMMRDGNIFLHIRRMIDFALNYHYTYFCSNSLPPVIKEVRGWVNDLSNYDANNYVKNMTMDDIMAVGEDTAWLLYDPQFGEPIDNDGAKKFLKAAKKAIQKMRYIRLANPNVINWDLGICDADEYKTIPSETIAIAVNNLSTSPDALTHDFHFPSAELFMLIRYGGYLGRYIDLRLRRKDLRWVNQFRWPVDLYAKIYSNPTTYYAPPVFDDFGLGFTDGQIISYGKKDIGEGIDNIFGINPLPITANAVFDGETNRQYVMLASLVADAGPYFNFNCSD